MDNNFVTEAFMALVSLMVAIIGFAVKGFKSDHDKLKESHSNLALNVSENYAKKNDLNAARLETNAGLERIHKRIDDVFELLKK